MHCRNRDGHSRHLRDADKFEYAKDERYEQKSAFLLLNGKQMKLNGSGDETK